LFWVVRRNPYRSNSTIFFFSFLQEYTAEDVRQHDSLENRIWVSFKHGVYDITDFIPRHPGADKILMAAGLFPTIKTDHDAGAKNLVSVAASLFHFCDQK
jgi:cytochrome b involved in lipid metabolism